MSTKEQAADRRKFQGKLNKTQGAMFERLIEAGCDFYRQKGIADIEKTPEPMQPIKDMGGGKFIAHYTSTAQADFKGFLKGGMAVNFEAKYTDIGKITQNRVTPDQAERLERAYRYGAHAFVLCSFGAVGFYRIPWVVWRDMKAHYGHKYITPQEAEPFKVRIGGPGVLLFLEGLEESCAAVKLHHERIVGIYAKAQMETMPGSCTECKFGERYGCVGDVKCRILRAYFTGNVEPPYKERPDACPLVEMEKPQKSGSSRRFFKEEIIHEPEEREKVTTAGASGSNTRGQGCAGDVDAGD